MIVHNLTDVETPKLKQHMMVDQTIAVGPKLLQPGEKTEVADEHTVGLLEGLQHLVNIGAVAVGAQPPAQYVLGKASAQAKAIPIPVPDTAHAETVPPPSKKKG